MKWVRNIRWACAALAFASASIASAQVEGEPVVENPIEKVEGATGSFGQAGQLVISQDLQLSLQYNTAGSDNFTLLLAPGADYFPWQNVSLGLGVNLGQIFQSGDDATSIGLEGRIGYNLAYDEKISFWPKASLGFVYNKTTSFLFGADGTFLELGLFAPVLLHPVSNFFVGLGPNLDILVGDSTGLNFGVRSVVGGYF